MQISMTTKEAIEARLAEGLTKYRIAQDLDCAPILVDYWLNGTCMGQQYCELFKRVYGVIINDR